VIFPILGIPARLELACHRPSIQEMFLKMKETIYHLVRLEIAELNKIQSEGEKLNDTPGTLLIGEGSKLDSLALISFITGVESRIRDELKVNVTIFNEGVFSGANSPLRTLDGLVAHILKQIESNAG